MKLFSRFNKKEKEQIKANPVYGESSLVLMNDFVSSPKNMRQLQIEGYAKNPTIYRCVREIATNAARVPLYLKNAAGKEIEKHPLLDEHVQEIRKSIYKQPTI